MILRWTNQSAANCIFSFRLTPLIIYCYLVKPDFDTYFFKRVVTEPGIHSCSEVTSSHSRGCAMEDTYPVWVEEKRRDASAPAVGQGICRCLDTGLQAEPLPSAQQILMGCGQLSEGTCGALSLPHCPCLRDTVKQEDDRQLAKKLNLKPTYIQ